MPFSQLNWKGRLTRSAIGFDSFFARSALLSVSLAAGAGAAAPADAGSALVCCADRVAALDSPITVSTADRAKADFITGRRWCKPPSVDQSPRIRVVRAREARGPTEFRDGVETWSEAERAADLNLARAQTMVVLVDPDARQELRDQIETRDRRPHEIGGVAPRQVIRIAGLDAEVPDHDAARGDGRVKSIGPPVLVARESGKGPERLHAVGRRIVDAVLPSSRGEVGDVVPDAGAVVHLEEDAIILVPQRRRPASARRHPPSLSADDVGGGAGGKPP